MARRFFVPVPMTKGFTLAELLISLAILGVIATFTIPKILTAQADAKCKSVMKESIGMLSALVYQNVVLEKNIYWSGGQFNGDYLLGKINAIKICDNNAEMLGCWDSSFPLAGSTNNGVVLASGAVIVGPGLSPNGWSSMSLDCNGTDPPNLLLQDQIGLIACYEESSCDYSGYIYKPGTVVPNPYTNAGYGNIDSTPMFEELFAN